MPVQDIYTLGQRRCRGACQPAIHSVIAAVTLRLAGIIDVFDAVGHNVLHAKIVERNNACIFFDVQNGAHQLAAIHHGEGMNAVCCR